jgi:hypothetical protein
MKIAKLTKILCGFCAAWLVGVSPAGAQLGVSVININGQTTVTWRGQQVFSGPTKGPVSGQSASVGREEYAAALDGNEVLWENTPGAAQKLKSAATAAANLDRKSGARSKAPPSRTKRPQSTGLWVSSADGVTTVKWNGTQVFVGPTKEPVTAKSKTVDGVECVAVFEGTSVLWENQKGAAKRLK